MIIFIQVLSFAAEPAREVGSLERRRSSRTLIQADKAWMTVSHGVLVTGPGLGSCFQEPEPRLRAPDSEWTVTTACSSLGAAGTGGAVTHWQA